jgi:hypothetical protein
MFGNAASADLSMVETNTDQPKLHKKFNAANRRH